MNYSGIKKASIENGEGCRTSFFVSGCTHHCKGCFNEKAWDFNYGEKFSKEVMEKVIYSLRPKYIKGITVLGGEPMEVRNQSGVKNLILTIKETFEDKDIWIYTGYLFDDLINPDSLVHTEDTMEILKNTDILVDGKFELEKKDLSLRFKGSSNQRVIDVKRSLKEKKIILSEFN